MIANVNDVIQPLDSSNDQNRRGMQVYSLSQLLAITGRAKNGERITGYYDQSIHALSYDERLQIYRFCAPVQAVVTSRMNAISAMNFEVIADKKNEDKIADRLKNFKSVWDEYKTAMDSKYIVARGALFQEIKRTLVDVLPDLSNFDRSLLRWKKQIQSQHTDEGEWIKEWILTPNINDRFEEFIKKTIFDLMIHGAVAWYKEPLGGRIENLYCLPGGTVIPLKNKFVNGANAYVQVTNMMNEPMIYFSDELAFANYLPTSARGYGYVPLECLVNKIAETLFFDDLMAQQADGTKLPEKMVIVTDNTPFGDLQKEFNVPIDPAEQKRIEAKMNTPKKGSIITFTGNSATVVDLSRENTMGIQMQRQKDIREEVGLVFQATQMEMNLSGSDNTSGRSTSEAQREIYHSRGTLPMTKIIEMLYNREVLPFRFGNGWSMEYDSGKSEAEDLELLQLKVNTGLYTVNELRQDELNMSPFSDEQYNKPTQGKGGQPDGSALDPLNVKGLL